MTQDFLTYSIEQSARLDRVGTAQLAGFALAPNTSSWRGRGVARALIGYLTDQVVVAAHRGGSELGQLELESVWCEGRRSRRLIDLWHDALDGRRDHWSMQGMSGKRAGRGLSVAHIGALETALTRRAQAQNLSRLFRLAERLDRVFLDDQARDLVLAFDREFSESTGASDFFGWSICSRFHPINFSRGLRGTRAQIASLFMSERDMLAYAPQVSKDDSRAVRVALLVALRRLNAQMEWTRIGEAFPERLVMTQKDTKKGGSSDDGPGSGGSGHADLLARIEALAARTVPAPGDAELWDALRDDDALFTHYTRTRAGLEEAAEAELDAPIHTTHGAPTALPWWRKLMVNRGMELALAGAVALMIAGGWWYGQTVESSQGSEGTDGSFQPGDITDLTDKTVTPRKDVDVDDGKAPEGERSPSLEPSPSKMGTSPDPKPDESSKKDSPPTDAEILGNMGEKGEPSKKENIEAERNDALRRLFSTETQAVTKECLTKFVQRGKSFDGDIVLGIEADYDFKQESLSFELSRVDTRGSENSPLSDFDAQSYQCWADGIWQVTIDDPKLEEHLIAGDHWPVALEVPYGIKVKGASKDDIDTKLAPEKKPVRKKRSRPKKKPKKTFKSDFGKK